MSWWARKYEMDDTDRAVLAHMIRMGEVLEHECPQTVIDWNKALDEVSEKPKSKTKKRRKK